MFITLPADIPSIVWSSCIDDIHGICEYITKRSPQRSINCYRPFMVVEYLLGMGRYSRLKVLVGVGELCRGSEIREEDFQR